MVIEELNIPDILEYTGEFRNELVLFLPFIYWLDQTGLLKERHLKTYAGMRSFYLGVTPKTYSEKTEDRGYVHVEHRAAYLPNKTEEDFLANSCLVFPDFRKMFSNFEIENIFERPTMVIHNKYNFEWSEEPVNFLSIDLLRNIFEMTSGKFEIIYIRHRKQAENLGFSWDHNEVIEEFGDQELINRYNHVTDFYNLYSCFGRKFDTNQFKNILYARSHYFISSQGGGAYQLSYFSGAAIAILHRRGMEIKSAYESGFFKMTSNPNPQLLICLDEKDVLNAVTAMMESSVFSGRVIFPVSTRDTLEVLSPERQKQVFYQLEYERNLNAK
jgi:hypothetical protein